MPRPGFRGQKVRKDDMEKARSIRNQSSAFTKNALRYIRQLESFLDANEFADKTPGVQILELFYGQYLSSQRSAKTLLTVSDTLRTFGVSDPRRLEEAKARIQQAELRSGIERMAAATKKRFVRREVQALVGIPDRAPSDSAELARMAFWCLIVATGNRAASVLKASITRVNDQEVAVHWGLRKIRSDINATYRYAWTATPPAWVRKHWKDLVASEEAWVFCDSANIAAAVNGWLKRWKINATSSSPRATLDRCLLSRLEARDITEAQYEILMDHNENTSRRHYVTE